MTDRPDDPTTVAALHNNTIDRLRGEIVRQHDRIRELEEERDKLREDRDRLSAELQRVVVDEHLDVPPFENHFVNGVPGG